MVFLLSTKFFIASETANKGYAYDAENHVTKLSDGTTLTFTYNGEGARFSQSDGTTTTKFVFD
jgi:YD repeat-containing protein